MAWTFNPFTDSLDKTGAGASYIDGVVADSSLLPTTLGTPALDSVYLAKAGSGVWLINRKPGGLYVRVANNGVAADWQYLGAFPEVNADGNWELYNSTDPTKELKFDLSGLTTGTTSTLTVPASGTIALLENFLSVVKNVSVVSPSSDYTVNNTNVPSDVPGASFSTTANTSYVIISAAQVSNAYTSGHDVLVNVPSLDQVSGGAVGGFGIYVTGNNLLTSAVTYNATTLRLLARGAPQTGMSFSIVVLRVGGTGGTANIQFCQNGAQANDSTLLATSKFLVIPIST